MVALTSASATPAVDYAALEAALLDSCPGTTTPLHERFRALFTLKSLHDDPRAVDIIAKGFADESALLKHELAYVLGQMRNKHAVPHLNRVLEDKSQDNMVRHEAAEALGAIADESSLPVLERFLADEAAVVSQTCELAIERIKFERSQKSKGVAGETIPESLYSSVDPAPPSTTTDSTPALRQTLLDAKLPLFERYRAMFALRNKGDVESVLALAEGLKDESALFRHEIAYVFGQMQHPASVPALVENLEKETEEDMVRHECAEALGSIATEEVYPVLRKHAKNSVRVVRESCEVALDMADYENSDQLHYADGLERTIGRQ